MCVLYSSGVLTSGSTSLAKMLISSGDSWESSWSTSSSSYSLRFFPYSLAGAVVMVVVFFDDVCIGNKQIKIFNLWTFEKNTITKINKIVNRRFEIEKKNEKRKTTQMWPEWQGIRSKLPSAGSTPCREKSIRPSVGFNRRRRFGTLKIRRRSNRLVVTNYVNNVQYYGRDDNIYYLPIYLYMCYVYFVQLIIVILLFSSDDKRRRDIVTAVITRNANDSYWVYRRWLEDRRRASRRLRRRNSGGKLLSSDIIWRRSRVVEVAMAAVRGTTDEMCAQPNRWRSQPFIGYNNNCNYYVPCTRNYAHQTSVRMDTL